MTIVQLDKDCLKALIEGNGEGSTDLSQLHAKDTELTNRVNVLEEAKPVVENKLTALEAKNTAQDEKITALENRTDNFVNNVAVSKEGKKVKLTYTRVDGTSSEVEFEDSDTVTLAYDDEPLKTRIKALEDKPDKDTIYNDTEVKQGIKANEASITALEGDVTALRTHTDARLEALENKVDNDTIYDDTAVRGQITALESKVTDNKSAQDAKNTELENKITALETKPDKDTVYDDTALSGRVTTLETAVTDNKQAQDTKNSELDAKDKELEGKVKALEAKEDNDKQTLSLTDHTLSISNGNSVELPKYDDTALKAKGTEQDEAINALKEKTKSFLTGASLARQGDTVTLTYTNIDGTSTNLEFEDHDTKVLAYDDTALKTRVQELENKTDKDTVYDDAPIKARISALESKEDKDTKYNVKSTTEGVTVTKSEEANETVFTVNADEALKNRTTTEDVKKLIEENNKRTAKVTLTHGTYIDESKFTYGFDNRKPEFVYNDVTHFGTFKVDGFIKNHLENHGVYLASMPESSPKPLSLLEFLVYINNKPVNVWLDTSGNVRANGITDDMIGQRIVVTFVGLFI